MKHRKSSMHRVSRGLEGGWGLTWREQYAVDPESVAVLVSHGPLTPGVGDLFRTVFEPSNHDAIVLGVDPRRAFDAAREFPGCSMKVGDGPSGGELALIAALDCHHIAGRFQGLTVCSGDGAFVPLVRQAQALGLRIRVASWVARLSGELGRLADEVVLFDHFLAHPAAISTRARTMRGAELPVNDHFVEAA